MTLRIEWIYAFYLRKDAASLAAWRSARDVAWPAPSAEAEVKKPYLSRGPTRSSTSMIAIPTAGGRFSLT